MASEDNKEATPPRRLRLGMVGGGRGAFIGAVHRIAARMDDRYELVAGALSSDPERAWTSATDLRIAPNRSYSDFRAMAKVEAARPDGIDVVAIVTPNNMHYEPARAFLEAGVDVICDKPLTSTLEDALDLQRIVKESGLVFGLTHNYTGYPLVRQARDMVAADELGRIRIVQVEYAQDWLTTKLEDTGHRGAIWRTDPKQCGVTGCVGEIGTHAVNLAEFVSHEQIEAVTADLTAFVPGRPLDDNAGMLLRFAGGARGMLWSSQVAVGRENGLALRIYGEKASLEWAQEEPNVLSFTRFGEPPRRLTRAGPGLRAAATCATRVPSGHPEGYLEAFAVLYRDLAEQITARRAGRAPDPSCLLAPGIDAGVRGMQFVAAAAASSRDGSRWTRL
jgi:predicted dehydrogenase